MSESAYEPLRVEPQFPAAFRASWIRALLVVKARHFDACLSGTGPRVGVPDVRHELPICETPPRCGLPRWRWSFWRDHISASPTHLDVALLSLVGKTGSAGVQVFFRGDWSIGSHSFHVSVGGGEFRIFLCRHPEPTSFPLFLSAFNTY